MIIIIALVVTSMVSLAAERVGRQQKQVCLILGAERGLWPTPATLAAVYAESGQRPHGPPRG